eukprot:TRINITY_DN44298_c2_g1_i1.p1 TRINITY_DN44298_c2_g1~~TRINITY_DN44298_c2_g1_i1.p1  ORF type:complete len:235 (+),score=74.45 TRINITY_DN44298_c2_g1_i1:80-706(+)
MAADNLDRVVSLLSATDARDQLLKAAQSACALRVWSLQRRGHTEDAQRVGAIKDSLFDTRALLWMGRWLGFALRFRRVWLRSAKQGMFVLDLIDLVKYLGFGLFFFLDNIRWLRKHKALGGDPQPVFRLAKAIQLQAYLLSIVASAARLTRGEVPALPLVKDILDTVAVVPLTGLVPWFQPPPWCTAGCGLLSAGIATRTQWQSTQPH